jgi:hypothetical protein
MQWLRFIVLMACLALVTTTATLATRGKPRGDGRPAVRLLFVGNSYTFVNDLPGVFAMLANAGGHRVDVETIAKGGWTLASHEKSAKTLDRIANAKWDYVVLQEQSQIPASERARAATMYPAAHSLARRVTQAGAQPLLFMTWAHRRGWPEERLPNYDAMQAQITRVYVTLAKQLRAATAPVGEAWAQALRRNASLELWQADGSHPSEQGTYLAACVFYAVVFRETPQGLPPVKQVPREIAEQLQRVAADTVLADSSRWDFRQTDSSAASSRQRGPSAHRE